MRCLFTVYAIICTTTAWAFAPLPLVTGKRTYTPMYCDETDLAQEYLHKAHQLREEAKQLQMELDALRDAEREEYFRMFDFTASDGFRNGLALDDMIRGERGDRKAAELFKQLNDEGKLDKGTFPTRAEMRAKLHSIRLTPPKLDEADNGDESKDKQAQKKEVSTPTALLSGLLYAYPVAAGLASIGSMQLIAIIFILMNMGQSELFPEFMRFSAKQSLLLGCVQGVMSVPAIVLTMMMGAQTPAVVLYLQAVHVVIAGMCIGSFLCAATGEELDLGFLNEISKRM